MRDALRDAGLAGPAARARRTRAAYRISRGAYRARPDGSKAAALRSASSPPSSASGNTASALTASKTTPARRGWRFARMPAWRWRGSASISTTGSRSYAVRARYGPPAASRSIPARRASSRATRKCCSRFATKTPRVIERLEYLLRSMAAEVSATGTLQRRGGAHPHRRARHDGCRLPAGHRGRERRPGRRQVGPHAQRRRS